MSEPSAINLVLTYSHSASIWLSDLAWGWPLMALLLGGGIYLLILSRGLPFSGFFIALSLVSGRLHHKADLKAWGQLSHFQALMNAIAATVGLGNIGGVAVAISTGGPGAIFWMWVAAFVGMNTKFFECTLALMFRGQDYAGEPQGGPMYVISSALPSRWGWMGSLFSIFGLLGCLALYNVNQLTDYVSQQYEIERVWTGGFSALIIGYILMGGLRRISQVTSALVPTMCLLYVASCSYILMLHYELILPTLGRIIIEAFAPSSIGGGVLGLSFQQVLLTGVKRAAFSNEAGMGTAPMAHGNAKTGEPVSEGLVAMLGPLIDTLVICTMTALVILISFPDRDYHEMQGVLLTLSAFETNLPQVGGAILGLSIFLFSFTTMLGMANYNEKCWNYLFRGRYKMGRLAFTIFFSTTLFIGALFPLETVINLLDAGLGFMAFPNMIATLVLAPKVVGAMKTYMSKFSA